ncbi:hypothetical protein ACFSTE_10920 [Aquimarina hainanensis]|uniref:Uncharacterized protein n=1 Tax=Aquimarina hainanensis TaxID=1578017 RepID=A0ABW5N6U8_9FLAO
MEQLKLNTGQTITNKFEHEICQTYSEAIALGINKYEWKEDEILEREEKLSVQVEDLKIIHLRLDCLVVDTGSNDYIFYINKYE